LTPPPAPRPIVEAEICPALTSDTEPALPLLPGLACDKMPVWKIVELPSIDAAPNALTETFPALPVPVVC
jgi:hypothetical protein